MIGLAVLSAEGLLLGSTLIVKDRVRGLLITVRGMVDQGLLRLLEALGLAAPSLLNWTPRGIGLLDGAGASDFGGFPGCLVGLLLLVAGIGGHYLLPCESRGK
jgi:hypothetical protein